jgi:hypothetical protein
MDLLSIVLGALPVIASSFGPAGKVLAIVIAVAGGLSGVVTALVMLWHAVVIVVKALSVMPGLSALAKVSDMLSADEQKISDFSQGKILPVLNRLSAVQLPAAK